MPVGVLEILLVFLVFLILGPRRIANLFRSLGTGINDFVETLGRDKERNELPEEDKNDEHQPKS
jgi:sec-independent protein translocase protein TatA